MNIINAIAEPEHSRIRIEVHQACIIEYSDDQKTWHVLTPEELDYSGPVAAVLDYKAPLNRMRYYRAHTGGVDCSWAILRPPGYVEPTLGEIRERLAESMRRGQEMA